MFDFFQDIIWKASDKVRKEKNSKDRFILLF